MKLPVILLTSSIAANVVLLTALAIRPTLAPQGFRDFFGRGPAPKDIAAESRARQRQIATQARAAAAHATGPESKLWSALQSDDLPTLIARLRAAGFPAPVVRAVIDAQLNGRFAARVNELTAGFKDTPYWKADPMNDYMGNQKFFEAYNQLYRERSKILRELLGDDFFAYSEDPPAAQRRQFGDLPRNKVDLIQRINDDYTEMTAQIRAAMQNVTLPEDREKLALLERERRADLAAVLTPQELADYEMRTSNTTGRLRNALTLMDATEDEFRTIYRIQQGLADKINPPVGATYLGQEFMDQRRQAQQQADQMLRTSLGDQRYAEYVRASTNEFQQLTRLAQRDNLPPDAAVRAYVLRDTIAAESNRIVKDVTLTSDQQRTALQTLAQNTRAQLIATLGPTAGPAYVQAADRWLRNVENGSAVTFGSDNAVNFQRVAPPASAAKPSPSP